NACYAVWISARSCCLLDIFSLYLFKLIRIILIETSGFTQPLRPYCNVFACILQSPSSSWSSVNFINAEATNMTDNRNYTSVAVSCDSSTTVIVAATTDSKSMSMLRSTDGGSTFATTVEVTYPFGKWQFKYPAIINNNFTSWYTLVVAVAGGSPEIVSYLSN